MSISAGLVGLPNVGKSTLFNALTKSSIPAENYPFCTIDPHLACTFVPDKRAEKLQEIYKSGKIIQSTVQFVDIAGLVKGAASGEGLGNQFLSNIREVDLILHVVRCFEDPDIIYSHAESIDPLADLDIINTELMLKDIESIEKRIEKVQHSIKANKHDAKKSKEFILEFELLEQLQKALEAQDLKKIQELVNQATIATVPLLCAKKFLIIANLAEHELENEGYKNNKHYQKLIAKFGENIVIPISAKIEHELSQLTPENQEEMRSMLSIDYNGLDLVISKTYTHLGLITFFTCGPQEIHAWPIKKGMNIRQAGGEIHSDLERGFICAEIFNYNDIATYGSIAKLKEAGKMRTEGQDYIVQDGDIVLIRFNV